MFVFLVDLPQNNIDFEVPRFIGHKKLPCSGDLQRILDEVSIDFPDAQKTILATFAQVETLEFTLNLLKSLNLSSLSKYIVFAMDLNSAFILEQESIPCWYTHQNLSNYAEKRGFSRGLYMQSVLKFGYNLMIVDEVLSILLPTL